MKRRDFIKVTTAAATAATGVFARAEEFKRPNIIYIYTDQQSATMMSCAGNKWLKTPAMDYIAANGIRFERAYTTNPVCLPARVSLMTGRFPDYFSKENKPVRENGGGRHIRAISDEVEQTTISAFLKKAEYELAYGGKVHLPEPLAPHALGFNVLTGNERDGLAKSCADYIKQKHHKPYFLVASFINPHDICYMAIRDNDPENKLVKGAGVEVETLDLALETPPGVSEEKFFEKYCPPVPPNYEPQADEPKAIKSLLQRRAFRLRARNNYSDKDWRRHRWAYCRLTEMVDKQIQVLLDALKESGQEENTVVIFSSDHGDNDASHRMEHKTAFYEESARIPFMVMHKGHIKGGVVDDEHLVSNGLDLLPTVCDYAGIDGKSDPRGLSVKSIVEGKKPSDWRKSLGVESEIGRMVVGDKCKYIKYDAEGEEVQLLDLKKDPHETRHFTNEKSHAEMLAEMKQEFEEWFPRAQEGI